MQISKVFSIKNKNYNGKIFKVVNIFGISIKFFNIKKTLELQLKTLNQVKFHLSQGGGGNIISTLIEAHSPSELLCMKSKMQAIIINKDFFECDRQFVYDFLTYGCNAQDLRIFSLNKKCPLYKEHIAYSKENELVWKYATSGMDIYKTVVKKNNKGSLEISKKRSGTNNEYIIALSDFTKEYIDGTVLSNYLSVRNRQEKIEILTKYFDYIFSKYINPKTAKLPGYFFDMTPPNIIVNNDGFHIIDSWVSLKDYPECDKCFAIYAAARFEDEELYNYFVEKYKLNNEKEKYDFYLEKARKNLDKLQNNSSFKMQKNIDKYFNDRAFMPEYKL